MTHCLRHVLARWAALRREKEHGERSGVTRLAGESREYGHSSAACLGVVQGSHLGIQIDVSISGGVEYTRSELHTL